MVARPVRHSASVVAFAVCLHAAPAVAQSPTGTIQGTVVDPSGRELADVRVTVSHAERPVSRETVTDGRGFFAAPGLPPGEYELVAVLPGYATLRQSDARVHPGGTLALRLALRTAPAPETITLAGTPPALEPTRSHLREVLEPAVIANLPARRRNALNLVLLGPGGTRNVRTGEINFAALPGTLDRVLVDGTDAIGVQFGQEAVQELTITAGAAPAEYGSAGATVHIVTNSGANRLDGTAYEFYGDEGLNAHTDLDERLGRGKPSYGYNQFGGALGGPIVPDAHFFFTAYDGVRANEREHAQDHDVFLARSDHRLAETWRATLRYTHQDFTGGRVQAFNTAVASGLGATLFNEARVQIGTGRERGAPDDPYEVDLDRLQFADTLSWVLGGHLLEGGVDVLLDDIRSTRPFDLSTPGIDQYSLFVQDEWRASDALTLNAGVRYDLQRFEEPGAPQTDANNVGPRVGAAWAPVGRRYVVRGGYGLYYGRTPDARVHHANGGVEWEWMPHTTLAVSTLLTRASGLPDFRGLDVEGDRPLALTFARIVPLQGTAASHYSGISADVSRRFAQNHAYTLSYTFGDAEGTVLGPPGRFHRFVAATLYSTSGFASRFDGLAQSLLEAWMLSAIYSAQTGPPAWIALDARVARDVEVGGDGRLTLIWEAFNLLNRANGSAIDTRHPIGLNGPRMMQFAVKLSF